MTDSELDRLVKTVRHMLDFYRPGQVEKEFIDLSGVIDRVFYLLKSQLANHNIQTEVALAENCPSVRGVRDQIQQVIFNLVINAMDALETCSDRHIWIDAYPQAEDLVLTIEDSGPGIPEDMRDRLFEPFASTKPNGTGLGLAVSYGVVEAHGGVLTLQKGKHGKGACFEIRLPLNEEDSIQ
jgi:two-component system NtrC family sensor kinase